MEKSGINTEEIGDEEEEKRKENKKDVDNKRGVGVKYRSCRGGPRGAP